MHGTRSSLIGKNTAINKRTVVTASLVLLLLCCCFGGWAVFSHAKSIRLLPDRSSFLAAVTATEPLGLLYRVLLLQPGNDRYYAAIVPWLFYDAELADTASNRYLVERIMLDANENFAIEYLASYPISTTGRLTPLLEPLLEYTSSPDSNGEPMEFDDRHAFDRRHAASHSALMLLDQHPAGQQIISRWVENKIVQPRDTEVFREYFATLSMLESISLVDLIEIFSTEPGKPPDSEDRLDLPWNSVGQESPQLKTTLEWVLAHIGADAVVYDDVRTLLENALCADQTRSMALDWYRGLPKPERAHVFDAMFGGYDEYGPQLSEHGVRLHEASYEYTISSCVPDDVVELVVSEASDEPARQLAILHALLHANHAIAPRLVDQWLAPGDSALRKGVITLLARHGEISRRYNIDDAFRGAAPRLVLFRENLEYRESIAFQRYEALSGHAYDNVGKRFPPFFGEQSYGDVGTTDWRAYLDEFPWFPATDDAYYRLAYEYFLDGDLDGAQSVIDEYRSRTFIDADISPYVDQLEALVHALGSPRTLADAPLDPILHSVWLRDYDSGVQTIENAILVVDLMIAFEDTARAARIQALELDAAREALDQTRTECSWRSDECSIPVEYRAIRNKIMNGPTDNPIIIFARRVGQ